MLKKTTLINFQSHKKTVLDFCEGINVICGLSDSGKSGFIRGIRANIYREPFYIRNGESEGSVENVFDNETVERKCKFSEIKKCPECGEKTDGKQICQCGEILSGKPSADKYIIGPNTYDKFGKLLPDFIKEKIRMFPIRFVDIDENIQFFSQHEDMFFIGPSYSGGKRNKIISSLFPDSDRVDFLIKKFNSESSTKKARIDVLEQERDENQVKITDGKVAYDMIKILHEEIISLQEDVIELKSEMTTLSILKDKIDETKKVIKYEDKISKIKTVIDRLKEKFSEAESKRKDSSRLSEILSKVQKDYVFETKTFSFEEVEKLGKSISAIKRLESVKNVLSKTYAFEIKKFDSEKIINDWYELNRKKSKLSSIKTSITTLNNQIEDTLSSCGESSVIVLKKKEEFKKYLSDSKTLCPLIQDEFCEKCKGILSK